MQIRFDGLRHSKEKLIGSHRRATSRGSLVTNATISFLGARHPGGRGPPRSNKTTAINKCVAGGAVCALIDWAGAPPPPVTCAAPALTPGAMNKFPRLRH
ncbi:hypothetical protein EVAR_91441_1 [Eumeta japonica]|uniref:Uncharacterized protein n=1 Tax=Eumeta variegata TaxID=151549 RepID=A0A4C1X356_EUMVA|nr:hypothetical protein EVAR_91441_1 [Eumeta japonica]